jgi:hypothetical protein
MDKIILSPIPHLPFNVFLGGVKALVFLTNGFFKRIFTLWEQKKGEILI